MVLKSQGSIEGRECKTDRAYSRLTHLVEWLPKHAALLVIVEAVEKLDQRLQVLEGDGRGDEFREFDGEYPLSGDRDTYLEWLDVSASRDELAIAFFVTLQTRLTACKSACLQVQVVANGEGIPISGLPSDPPGDLWALANYCKHHDEWPTNGQLNPRQSKTFEALRDIPGHLVEGDASGERVLVDGLPTKACFAIAGKSTLTLAMSRLIDKAATHYRERARQIDQAFAVYESRLAELREQSAAKQRDVLARRFGT